VGQVIAAIRFVRDMPEGIDPNARLVAYAIASYVDHRGTEARPSTRQIAAATGLARNTVLAAIGRLEAAGVLAATRSGRQGDRTSTRYRFPVRDVELSTTGSARLSQLSYPQLAQSASATGSVRSRHLDNQLEENARADGSLWISGTGWCAPRAQGA
jgi:DNA-binding transcriptional MocR family regulator